LSIRKVSSDEYESGEIETSIAVLNELSKVLNCTSTYLLGYKPDGINITCIADIMDFLFKLEKKEDLNFSIDIKKPKTDGCWKCSVTFDGQDTSADYNNNPFDTKAAKMTFTEVYEEWSKKKYPTIPVFPC